MRSVDANWNRVINASNVFNDLSFLFTVATAVMRDFHVKEAEVQAEVVCISENGCTGEHAVVYADAAQQVRDEEDDG